MNKAQQMLKSVIDRQIANGGQVIVNQDIPLWEVRGHDAKSGMPVTIRILAENHYAATKKASKTIAISDCILVAS